LHDENPIDHSPRNKRFTPGRIYIMCEEEVIKIIIDEAIYLHKKLGLGLLENVYKTCLAYRLRKRGLFVEVEKPVPVFFEEVRMDCGYRADLVVERKVVVDTKTIDIIGEIEVAQVLTHLKFLELRHGLILNFKVVLMKYGIKRVLRGY
jgi:GxxExxY protein